MKTIMALDEENYKELLALWELSVTATHDFLSKEDIQVYRELIGETYLQSLTLFGMRVNGKIAGFIGLKDQLIQMLFVHPNYMRIGIGKALVDFAIKEYNVTEVDVNEQNTQALKFYNNLGFEAFDRFEKDDAGKPYPILSLALINKS